MFDIPLGMLWLGPTRYLWSEKLCGSLQNNSQKSLEDCKLACENLESCNAIEYKKPENRENQPCYLKNCTFPVPAPCGEKYACTCQPDEDCNWVDNELKLRGYYQATGKKQICI